VISEGQFTPAVIAEIEATQHGRVHFLTPNTDSTRRRRIYCLVRCHGVPLAVYDVLLLPDVPLNEHTVFERVMREAAPSVAAHQQGDIDAAAGEAACCADVRMVRSCPPQVDVIVPTRDRPEHVRKCIQQILSSDYPRDHITLTIVDNVPSSDATRQVVAQFQDDRVRYVRSDEAGSASARNAGLAATAAEIILFTDDDVVVDASWIVSIVAAFAGSPLTGCVTGLILPLEIETPAQQWFEDYGGFGKGFQSKSWSLSMPPRDDPLFPFAAGSFGSGNSMAFRRSTLLAVGNFDPLLGNGTPTLGGVDIEMFIRVIAAGFTLTYEPRAVIWHQHRRDFDALARQVYSYGVGLTAVMLRTVLHRPRLLGRLAIAVPSGVRYALASGSAKNASKGAGYPSKLRSLEVRGMLMGPIRYALSYGLSTGHRFRRR